MAKTSPAPEQRALIPSSPSAPYPDLAKNISSALSPSHSVAQELDTLADKYSLSAIPSKGFERTLLLAEGITALRATLARVIDRVMPLQNTQLGFLTDRKDDGYPEAVVIECVAEAVLRGLYPVGNEINIIAGKLYITKEGYARLVRELPGFTDLLLEPGLPKSFPDGAVVPYAASWTYHGKPYQLTREIAVRLNKGMGVDGAIGKATRKMLASIYNRCTGSLLTEGDADSDELRKLPVEEGELASTSQLKQIAGLSRKLELPQEEFYSWVREYGAKDGKPESLTRQQAEALITAMEVSTQPDA